MWHNLAERVEKAVARHRSCLIEPEPEPELPAGRVPEQDLQQAATQAAAARIEESALVRRTRPGMSEVQALLAQGKGIKPIMRELGLAKKTVRRFARAASAEDLLAKARGRRPSVLDDFKPYLHQRWNAGTTNALQLHAEIKAAGDQGSYASSGPTCSPSAPSAQPRHRCPHRQGPPRGQLDPARSGHPGRQNRPGSKDVRARCPHLDALACTSPNSPRSLPGCMVTAWTPGSPLSRPMTSPTCTPSPPGSNKTTIAVLNGLTLPLQLRRGRGQRQPDQDDQAPDVRPRQLRPAPQAGHPGRLRGGRIDHEMWVRTKSHPRSQRRNSQHTSTCVGGGSPCRGPGWTELGGCRFDAGSSSVDCRRPGFGPAQPEQASVNRGQGKFRGTERNVRSIAVSQPGSRPLMKGATLPQSAQHCAPRRTSPAWSRENGKEREGHRVEPGILQRRDRPGRLTGSAPARSLPPESRPAQAACATAGPREKRDLRERPGC